MITNLIGSRIKTARQQARLRQCDLANQIGICTRGFQNWELGYAEPKLSRLLKIAEATNKPLSFFIPFLEVSENDPA